MIARVKIAKSDPVFFDGTYISDGKWLAPVTNVTLADKELAALISAGVKFSRRSYAKELELNGKASKQDMAPFWASLLTPASADMRLVLTPWVYKNMLDDRIFRHASGRLVAIVEEYVTAFGVCDFYQAERNKPITGYDNKEAAVVLMPIALDLEALEKALAMLAPVSEPVPVV